MATIISKQGDFINLLAYVNAPRTNISQQVEILIEKEVDKLNARIYRQFLVFTCSTFDMKYIHKYKHTYNMTVLSYFRWNEYEIQLKPVEEQEQPKRPQVQGQMSSNGIQLSLSLSISFTCCRSLFWLHAKYCGYSSIVSGWGRQRVNEGGQMKY